MRHEKGLRVSMYLILIALVVIYVSIAVAILINDWFSWKKNALSDLGGPYSENPYVFNIGLILGGLLAIPFPAFLSEHFRSPVSRLGSLLASLGLFFLVLIGLFPEGTRLHYPSSWAFFMTMFLSILVMGFGLLLEKRIGEGFFGILLAIFSFFLAVGNQCMSTALREIVGALSITTWLLYWDYRLFVEKD